MVAKVTLTVKDGELMGREFAFDKPTSLVLGRAEDCSLRLTGGCSSMLVSRHHCLVDIDPPVVRVRDLGSLNGTYVNGKMIGHREQLRTAEEAVSTPGPVYQLADGDEIALGCTVLVCHSQPALAPYLSITKNFCSLRFS
jgi:pSer/pThr/pTyr-binding forkhead associated (FHA) protein